MNRSETMEMISRHKLQPTRSLGQNFLVDDRVIDMAVSAAAPDADTLVLEIGPGLGGLTRALAPNSGHVLAIEIDRYVLPALQEVVSPFSNVEILHADATQVDFTSLTNSWLRQGKALKVAANLPYYITSPLVEKLLSELPHLLSLTLMVQKEAAERLAAIPGSKLYGPVAVLTACFGTVRKLARVPAASFYPKPHVDSVLIQIQRQSNGLPAADGKAFLSFLNDCFARRRKTLLNSLGDAGWTHEKRNTVRQILSDLKLAENARPEHIQPFDYARMYHLVKGNK